MSDKVKHFLLMVVSTVAMWGAALLMDLVSQSGGMSDFGALIAFLASIALWITWGFTQFDSASSDSGEKVKRQAGEDARVALLLELLDEDERRALKQRLVDELSGDGEAVSLADLLAAEKSTSQRAGK
jgi:hypothetical protein